MYYKELCLPFDPWKGLPDHYFSKDDHKTPETSVFNKYIKQTDLNKETLDWFLSNGLYVEHSMIFSYLPHHKTSIHTDGFEKSNNCMHSAINFSIGGSGSIEWHEPLDSSSISPPKRTSVAKSPYHYIDRNKAKLLDTYEIKNPVLIDVATSHCGVNDSAEHRYSLTLRWFPKTSFQQSLEIFKPYFLE